MTSLTGEGVLWVRYGFRDSPEPNRAIDARAGFQLESTFPLPSLGCGAARDGGGTRKSPVGQSGAE